MKSMRQFSSIRARDLPGLLVLACSIAAVASTGRVVAAEAARGDTKLAVTAERLDPAEAIELDVFPAVVRLVGRDSRQQLLASIRLPSRPGTPDRPRWRDATRVAEYESLDPSIVTVSPAGILQPGPAGSGNAEVRVRVGDLTNVIGVEAMQTEVDLPVDFRRDIVPILTKAGCNGGGCHGKSGGRGGFELSLFGFEPDMDHHGIVRAARGRRLLPSSPAQSLLVLKPLGEQPHEGGVRLQRDTPEYRHLIRWIDEGTPLSVPEVAALQRIEIDPPQRALAGRTQQQFVVTAIDADGRRRDVTRTTEFRTGDTAVAEIDDHGLLNTHRRPGETSVVAIHRGQVAVSRVQVPLAEAIASTEQPPEEPAWDDALPIANFIDTHVRHKLRQLGIPPSPLADDPTFLRRVSLQIAGRLPTPQEIIRFAEDSSPGKRARVVDALLQSSHHADHFAQKWADILRNKRRGQKDRLLGTVGFHNWIRAAIARNMPYDQFVQQIITASGPPEANPPSQWYHEVRDLDQYVDDTAQVFLGVRIGCARCHHHPFEQLSQDDWYGLAAFFARLDRKGGSGVAERRANEAIIVKPGGQLRHPISGEVVAPRGLKSEPIEVAEYDDPRFQLVQWMRSPDNPYFAPALVNRLWAHFFGQGLVEPHDDLRVTNPATNQPLLDELAAEFVRSGYNMRHIIRLICTSSTYQLSSEANDHNLDDTQAHSRFYPQRLNAEPLLDAIDWATESRSRFSGLPAETLAIELPDEGFNNAFLKLFGRPPRESACECEREAQPSLSQALFLMNDGFVRSKINHKSGLAARLAEDPRELDQCVQELFLKTLGRHPSDEESQRAVEVLQAEPDLQQTYRDLLWVLLNTKEFLFIH